jgi:Holliday junction resolvase-like predicted endonuclease
MKGVTAGSFSILILTVFHSFHNSIMILAGQSNSSFRVRLRWRSKARYANLWFWRTQQGPETDFVYQAGGEITPIEVKFHEAETAVIPKALHSFAEAHKVSRAIVLTKRLWSERKDEKLSVRFLPVWMASRNPELLEMQKLVS